MGGPIKGQADYLELGDWNAVCSMCGRKFKASQLQKHWQGMWRCPDHWEPRHPQDFVRAVPDVQTPPWTQAQPADVFAEYCTPNTMTAIAFFAEAGCVIAGFISPLFDPTLNEE
jgi:hypothetical protein